MKKPLILAGVVCLLYTNSFSQNLDEVYVSPPVTPTVSYLVPVQEVTGQQSDTIVLKPNFLNRNQPLVEVSNPVHYPDLVWQQDAGNNAGRVPTATTVWQINGIAYTAVAPPDPSGEAGQSIYIQSINGSGGAIYKMFNKTTGAATTGNLTMNTLGGPTGAGDPIVLYDEAADRWLLTEFSSTGNRLIVHVSQTNNPSGAYWTYSYTCPTFPDYPKYAVWPNAYIVTTNETNPTIYALPRANMLAGTAGSFIRRTGTALAGFGFQTFTPADLDGDSLPPANMQPLVLRHRDDESHNSGSNNPTEDYIEIYQYNLNWVTPASSTFTLLQTIPVAEFDSDLCGLVSFQCIPQPTTSTTLDPLREPLMYKVTYRNFGSYQVMLMCLATDVNGSNLAGIRWIEMRKVGNGNWYKYQEGTYAPNDGLHRWMGSISMDKLGNIMLGFSVSNSSSKFPSLRFTGRKPCDPLGTMTLAEVEIAAGLGRQTGSNTRWGDYHHMSLDPVDELTFYFTGEYMPTSGSASWGTRIASFKFNPDANEVQPIGAFPTASICGTSGTLGAIIRNNGSSSLTTAVIRYKINSGTYTNYNYSGNLGTNATDTAFLSLTGLSAGTNTITIVASTPNGFSDDNACNDTLVVTVNANPIPTATTSITTTISCFGGSNGVITATPSGGTPGYTYSWAPAGGSAAATTGLGIGTYTVTVTDAAGCTVTSSANLTQPTQLTATITAQTNVTCFSGANGSATVTAGGGTPGYTYVWAPSGGTSATTTGSTAGTYTVTVTDSKGCTRTATVNITQPTQVTATVSAQTNVTCFGGTNGSATVTAGGGTPGYTYVWAPSGGNSSTASGLTAGTYTVTVTDVNGCTRTSSATITQPTQVTATITGTTPATCGGSNGTATVTAGGGAGGYTYGWAPGGGSTATVTNRPAGTYTVTVTDASGCTRTATATITQTGTVSATISSTTNATCGSANGSATISASGGTPGYTYVWAPSGGSGATATGLAAGIYTVTVTDAVNCSQTTTVTIGTVNGPAASISAFTHVSCFGGSNGSATVTPTGGTGSYTYAWAPGGGSTATITGRTAGSYTVTVTDGNGCTSTTSVTITQPSQVTATITGSTNTTCGGNTGTATVSAGGGTPGYTYVWAPSGGTGATATGLSAGSYTVTVTDMNACTRTTTVTITSPTPPSLSGSVLANVSCFGGSDGAGSVSASGGTPGYTYSWLPSGGTGSTAAGLGSGTYTITVTDGASCTATTSINITQPTLLSASITGTTNTTCGGSNGTATVGATGGTPGYMYAWAPSGGTGSTATGLVAGTYTVTVTDNRGCTTTATATVNSANGPTAAISTFNNITCFGSNNGTATVNPTGGTGGYTYQWSPAGGTGVTASGLSAGTYTVAVTDANNCTASATVTITEPAQLNVIATPQNSSCAGMSDGSVTITASGGSPAYQYSIDGVTFTTSNVFTNLAPGNYAVTVMDINNCSVVVNTTIAAPNTLAISSISTTDASGANDGTISVGVSGGTPGYEYSIDGTNYQAGNFFGGLAAGTYTVYVRDSKGCIVSIVVTVNPNTTGVEDIQYIGNVNIYPNPAEEEITISISGLNSPVVELKMYDARGRQVVGEVYNVTGDQFVKTFILEEFASGPYYVIIDGDKQKKPVVQKLLLVRD